MIEVELLGAETLDEHALPRAKLRRLCLLAAAAGGVEEGHLAVEIVDADRIARLNAEHRGKQGPTDVLSFPIDGGGVELHAGAAAGVPRELGDVLVCPEHTEDLCEAILHGVLHLVGMDHERDAGEMLALQAELIGWESCSAAGAATART